MTDTSYADTTYDPYGTAGGADHHTPDAHTGDPVPAAETEHDKPVTRGTGRRSGGRRRTPAVSIDKASVVKVLETRARVEQMNDTMRGIVAAVAHCDNHADSITVALLGDTSWIHPLSAVCDLAEQDSFDALVDVADMKAGDRAHIWTVLHDLSGEEKARLNSSVGKAARQVIEAVNGVDDDTRYAIAEILTVVTD